MHREGPQCKEHQEKLKNEFNAPEKSLVRVDADLLQLFACFIALPIACAPHGKLFAIDSAASPFHPFLTFHVIISMIVMVLYLHQVVSGLLIYFRNVQWPLHKTGGIAFIIFRIGNLVTSLFLDQFRP